MALGWRSAQASCEKRVWKRLTELSIATQTEHCTSETEKNSEAEHIWYV